MNRRVMLTGFTFTLAAATTGLDAWAESPLKQAVERLKTTPYFAFGGVGYAGTTSEGERNFRIIMAERPERALTLMEAVFAGNICAKCYALAGLRELSPERYLALSTPLAASNGLVTTMSGCIVEDLNVTVVLAKIDHGEYVHWTSKIRPATSPMN